MRRWGLVGFYLKESSMSIFEVAKKYLGQKEISPNKGFTDKAFDALMRKAGFYTGAAWCGFFCRLCYMVAGDKALRLLTGSAVGTMKKASKAGNWHTEPVKDAVVIYRMFKNGKAQSTGHMGVVTKVYPGGFDTIEGNTTDKGGREGIMVAERIKRSYKWDVKDGLRLMGFIHPEGKE